MGDTKGFAIPAERNPNGLPAELVFPWDQAAYVVTWAEHLGVDEPVRDRMSVLQKMLGDPSKVSSVLAAWQQAVTELTKAVDGSNDGMGLATANENLKARWAGTARDAAVDYVDRLATSTRSNNGHIAQIATYLNDLGAYVTTAYTNATSNVQSTAASLAQYEAARKKAQTNALIVIFTGGAGGTDSYQSAALEFVDRFMTDTKSLLDNLSKYMVDTGGKIDDVITKINQVEVPAAIAPAALTVPGWQPRNPTGPGWGTPS
ncbi:hypothetical protein [Nocardia vulneris]|uniref:PPE family domain-containing protein n=1 Tax=Nocardia vulneris TaxID=1141657 RepID=A0ABR4ZGA2_9NOCA|nr:hypothetical protein [Nocardia vulneris]KIA64329.1 hypothetical protein FG87_13775 [Nocardia vulneris]